MKTSNSLVLRLTVLLVALLGFQIAQAAVVTYSFDNDFSDPLDLDSASPDGTAPWLTASFDDGGTVGSVTLTMTFGADNGANTVNSVYFNLDPLLTAGDLTYTYISGASASVNTSGNLSAATAGDFDIYFDFPPPPGGGGADFFEAGETVVYTITGAGIDANSFGFESENPDEVAKIAAAQIQSTGNGEQSAWIAVVPIPAAVWLFGSGLIVLGGLNRRRKGR